eukprot:357217-Chlamydomonas_euryale.AAC.3
MPDTSTGITCGSCCSLQRTHVLHPPTGTFRQLTGLSARFGCPASPRPPRRLLTWARACPPGTDALRPLEPAHRAVYAPPS